jgi:alpha/beta superfamily hydrolase
VPRRIESHEIAGPAGELEALLEEPEDGDPREIAVVCHPHPVHGGTMLNKVVYRIARGLREGGAVVVRFNFRGVGRSKGKFDKGIGEVEDARAVLKWVRARYPQLPYTLAGFSFGSRVALTLACELNDAQRVIAVGFPTGREEIAGLAQCALNKIFVHSTVDVHGPRPELEAFFAKLPEPKRLIFIEAADHFFADALPELEKTIQEL